MTYHNGPGGLVIAVTHASGFGLLHFMTVDPAPQLMGQPDNQSQHIFTGMSHYIYCEGGENRTLNSL